MQLPSFVRAVSRATNCSTALVCLARGCTDSDPTLPGCRVPPRPEPEGPYRNGGPSRGPDSVTAGPATVITCLVHFANWWETLLSVMPSNAFDGRRIGLTIFVVLISFCCEISPCLDFRPKEMSIEMLFPTHRYHSSLIGGTNRLLIPPKIYTTEIRLRTDNIVHGDSKLSISTAAFGSFAHPTCEAPPSFISGHGLTFKHLNLQLRGGMDQAQLAELEGILDQLQRPDATPQSRQQAQQFALSLQNPADISDSEEQDPAVRRALAISKRLSQLQSVLDRSLSSTAQVVACNSLIALVTNHWDNRTIPHIEIRNYALGFLFAESSSPKSPSFVNRAMMRLLSRITKLGWLECDAHRAYLNQLNRFFEASLQHYATGLSLMYDLVEEMDLPAESRRTLVLRRQFIVSNLHRIFKTSLDTLRKLETEMSSEPEKASGLLDVALQLAVRCLSFDFVGQSDSDSDQSLLSLPLSWKDEISNPSLIGLLFQFYAAYPPPQSSRALELVLLLTSVPRAVYASSEAHAEVQTRLLDGIREILKSRNGLENKDNYHIFCRLLGSLRDVEYAGRAGKLKDYSQWLGLASNFTVAALQDWQLPSNSVHFLLQFWARLVGSSRPGSAEGGSSLIARLFSAHQASDHSKEETSSSAVDEFVPSVISAYIEGRLRSIEASEDGRCDDPLEDAEMLQSQLEVLPKISAHAYSIVGLRLGELLDERLKGYEGMMTTQKAASTILEGQLAWLVRVSGAMIGGHYTVETRIELEGTMLISAPVMSANLQQGDEMVDADITRRLLSLVVMQQNRFMRCDARLELALLAFLDRLKQGILYVDATADKDREEMDGGDGVGGDVRGALPAFLASMMGKKVAKTLAPDVYRRIFERIGLGDHRAVLALVVSKIVHNLGVWGDNGQVVRETLLLLATLVRGGAGEGAARLLLQVDVVKQMLDGTAAHELAFLDYPTNGRQRTSLFHTLALLVCLDKTDADASGALDRFVQPWLDRLRALEALPSLASEDARRSLIGAARDLRGVASALTQRHFPLLVSLLLPQMATFARAMEEWALAPDVTTAVLKLWLELADNKEGRFTLEASSPNGVLLFRSMGQTILCYGRRMLQNMHQEAQSGGGGDDGRDLYKERYKGIGLCLAIVALALTGDYVPLGALSVYGDTMLDDVMAVLVPLALSIPHKDLLALPKLATAYYAWVEALMRQAVPVVLRLETAAVVRLLASLHHGLANALQQSTHLLCARAIDRFAAFHLRNAHRATEDARRLAQHMLQVGVACAWHA